jgi:release factor glutamine methyltransferase
VRGADALEIGSGSGVVLAALGALGAASLFGIDMENEAVAAGTRLLRELGYGNAQFHQGDMWQPVAGRRFNVIAANLPQFPRMCGGFPDRLPSWSSGGPDGRSLLDPFLKGLTEHLAPGGAHITHNAFVDLELSRSIIEACGLSLRIAGAIVV